MIQIDLEQDLIKPDRKSLVFLLTLSSPQHLLFVKFDKPQLIGKSKLSKRKKINFFNSLFDFKRFLVLLLTSQGN